MTFGPFVVGYTSMQGRNIGIDIIREYFRPIPHPARQIAGHMQIDHAGGRRRRAEARMLVKYFFVQKVTQRRGIFQRLFGDHAPVGQPAEARYKVIGILLKC